MKNKIVFDFGFLNGEDSLYYISNKFHVVAVEANPILCEKAQYQFEGHIKSKKLILYNRAMSSPGLSSINFYINKKRPEVSSTEKWIAEQNGEYRVEKIKIKTISLPELIRKHGNPYYLKVDIEGMDKEISRQLIAIEPKPQYVSFELNKVDYLDIFMNLKTCKYNKFQLINQIHNKPNSSGVFGERLPPNKWMGINDAIERYTKYRELKIIDNTNLGVGWLDLHAKL